MENAFMGLPDFALGEAPHPAKQTTFKPLFDGARNLEMTSDIVIETPILEPHVKAAIAQGIEGIGAISPCSTQQNQTTKISLADHQDIIDELKKSSEAELKALEEKHQVQVWQQVENLKTSLFDDISKQLEDRISQTLAPLIEKCVSRNTVEAMVKEIRTITAKDAVTSLQISGPSMLTSAVKQQLSGSQLTVDVEEGEGVELVVSLNDKVVSTRLKEWGHRIEGAIL